MPGNKLESGGRVYLKIIAGGLKQSAKEGDVGAERRDYETPDGKKGTKFEIPYLNWTAKIVGITFKESEYGEMCNVELDDATLQLNTASRYFQDFACKVFNADLNQPLLFHPYDMLGEGDKKITGISLQQNGIKLKNYFYDFENKVNLHGFPEVDQNKKLKKTYWKVYFTEVADFLVEKLKELAAEKLQAGKLQEAPSNQGEVAKAIFPQDDDYAKDLPFN